ncbi:MAG: hypothetical protein ACK53C_11130 [Pseudomonadota bacterium]|jgi:hypothetical protein
MTACRCEDCAPADPAPTYSQAHRHACEVRHVAGMATNKARAAYLAAVAAKRSEGEAARLRADTWYHMKGTQA